MIKHIKELIASYRGKAKTVAGEVAVVAASIAAVLAIAIASGTTLHIPAATLGILVAVSSVVAGVANQARKFAASKVAARKAAKAK